MRRAGPQQATCRLRRPSSRTLMEGSPWTCRLRPLRACEATGEGRGGRNPHQMVAVSDQSAMDCSPCGNGVVSRHRWSILHVIVIKSVLALTQGMNCWIQSVEGEGDEAWKMEESREEMLPLLLVPLHKCSGYGSSKAMAVNTYNSLHQIDPTA